MSILAIFLTTRRPRARPDLAHLFSAFWRSFLASDLQRRTIIKAGVVGVMIVRPYKWY